MANELVTNYPISGASIYATIRNLLGKVWYISGQAFETWGSGGRTVSSYAISLTDKSGGLYIGDFDSNIIDGSYYVQIWAQSGSSPDETVDVPIGGPQRFYWYNGTLYQDDTISSDSITTEEEEEEETETATGEGTVTSTTIESRVRQITKRDNTTDLTSTEISNYTYEAVREISSRLGCLKEETSGTLEADVNTITAPSDMILSEAGIDELYLGDTLLDPLTFDEGREGIKDGYAYRDGTIYVNPTSDNDRTYTLYYSSYHSTTVTTILLNDDFKMAIVYLVCQKIYDDYEIEDKANRMMQKYEREIEKFSPVDFGVVRIRQFSKD